METVYITKWALTEGIQEYDTDLENPEANKSCRFFKLNLHIMIEGKDFFLDLDSAIKEVERKRDIAIAAMVKNLEDMRNLDVSRKVRVERRKR